MHRLHELYVTSRNHIEIDCQNQSTFTSYTLLISVEENKYRHF